MDANSFNPELLPMVQPVGPEAIVLEHGNELGADPEDDVANEPGDDSEDWNEGEEELDGQLPILIPWHDSEVENAVRLDGVPEGSYVVYQWLHEKALLIRIDDPKQR
ncbi:unnamed protein product, partial [Mesorhabditis spiculigera]